MRGGGKGALVQTEKSGTLATNNDQVLFIVEDVKIYENHREDARYEEKDKCPTMTARMGTGGGNVPLIVFENDRRHSIYKGTEVSPTLTAKMGTGGGNVPIKIEDESICYTKDAHPRNAEEAQTYKETDKAHTLNCFNNSESRAEEVVATCSQVRRLTPRECERLQNFPDDWTLIPYNGKPADKCPDAPRYKALGNSWNVNCVRWIGQRIDDFLEGRLQ